jgi:YVTN family beta-propeller protein
VIDGESDSVISTVAGIATARAICYDPGYNSIYCSSDGSSVTVIDGATDSVKAVIRVGLYPRGMCLNPSQDRVYVANSGSSSISIIRTSPPGIEESFGPKVLNFEPLATVVRGVLVLGAVGSRQNTEYGAGLMDIGGRKVMDLHPGANDVRALAPGVYFVREAQAQAQAQAIRKVVVTR